MALRLKSAFFQQTLSQGQIRLQAGLGTANSIEISALRGLTF